MVCRHGLEGAWLGYAESPTSNQLKELSREERH